MARKTKATKTTGTSVATTTEKPKSKRQQRADEKAAQSAALDKLHDIAHEVNVRFTKSDDMRLAASLQLVEAKKIADAANINWKQWVEKNIEQSYETVRKLLPVGEAESKKEGKGAKMLADMRKANAAANRAHRQRKKTSETPKTDGETPKGASAMRVTPEIAAIDLIGELDDEKAAHVIKESASKIGLVVTPKDAEPVSRETTSVPTVASVAAAFAQLKATDKMAFLDAAAKAVGVTVNWPEGMAPAPASDGDLFEIPGFLRRTDDKGKSSRRARRGKKAAA